LLEIEWVKANFNPITGDKLENFLSFEEWIKL